MSHFFRHNVVGDIVTKGGHQGGTKEARMSRVTALFVGIAALTVISTVAEAAHWTAGPDLGERWPSRLVVTAEENRLSCKQVQ